MARMGSAVLPYQFHLLVLFVPRDVPLGSPTTERTLEEGCLVRRERPSRPRVVCGVRRNDVRRTALQARRWGLRFVKPLKGYGADVS